MISCLLHLDLCSVPGPRHRELSTGAAALLSRLRQHSVSPALLLQCSSAADAAACLAVVRPAAEAAAAALSLAQLGQLPVALRLALDQLSPAVPPAVVLVSVSDSSAAASQAQALGCATEHLPARTATAAQLQTWGLQAVAELAAARAAVRPIVVGYVMKESRQVALSMQGMLPLLPLPLPPESQQSAAGAGAAGAAGKHTTAAAAAEAAAAGEPAMCFVPLDLGSSLPHQLRRCQVVLQKLTDCLQPGEGSGAVAALTCEAEALLRFLSGQQQGREEQGQGQAGAASQLQPPSSPPSRQQQQAQAQQQQQAWVAPPLLSAPAPPTLALPCLVDPPESLLPIMDRALLIPHLEAAALAVRQRAIPMRAPASAPLRGFDPEATPRQLAAAGVGLPCIVKPQAACGVAEAHQMAFVLHGSGFAGLEVPLPAVAQEYVDHGGTVWKVYVAGEQVFWTQRKSTPDLGPLARLLSEDPEADIPSSIGFDSLKSLPTTLPWLRLVSGAPAAAPAAAQGASGPASAVEQANGRGGGGAPGLAAVTVAGQQLAAGGADREAGATAPHPPSATTPPLPPGHELMRRPTFEAVAAALRQRFGLTLFGFDLVFDRAAGELVIIDVNYFPSFKGIPEAPAALQAALRQRYADHLARGAQAATGAAQ